MTVNGHDPWSEAALLRCPDGFDWRCWETGIRCVDCGIVFDAVAPTVEAEQRAYDEMAVEHRRRCPGDGA